MGRGRSELVGALSPVNHRGLHQGWRGRTGALYGMKTAKADADIMN